MVSLSHLLNKAGGIPRRGRALRCPRRVSPASSLLKTASLIFWARYFQQLYNPSEPEMFHKRTLNPILAAALSFWMAAVACVLGCMQPVLANPAPQKEASIGQTHSRNQADTGPMPDMNCCHHEKSPSDPASDKKPHHEAVSCCPLDARVTPAKKFEPPLAIAFKSDVVSSAEFDFPFALFRRSFLIDDALSHTGRDTLLKTHVLRI
jgi:hypothetical protein